MFFKGIHMRIRIVLLVIIFLFILIIGKVFYIQVIDYDRLNQYASNLWSRNLPIEANRGLIYDRNGVVLADNILKRLNKLKEMNIQGNFMKPFLIKGKDANYGLQLDNREPNCIRFTIRNFIEQPEDWGNKTNGQSVLEFSVDKDGKIVFGEFDKRESENYSKRYEFKKVSDKINRIKTNEGLTLQNSRQRDKFTTKVDLCKNKISREYDMYKDFAELDAGMSEIFFKLGQGRALFV